MVKLQKSLTKPVDIIEKKKRKVPSPPLAGISKITKKHKPKDSIAKLPNRKKERLVKTIAKDFDGEVPVGKEKKSQFKDAKKTSSEQFQEKSQLAKKEPKAKKKPLVLAPPDSPAASLQEKTQHKKSKVQKKVKKAKTTAKEQTHPLTNLQKKKTAKQAFKKQQIKKRRENKTKKPRLNRLFKAPPFDEDKFNAIVNEDNIKKIVKGLRKQVEMEVSQKKTAIFSDFQYCLNVGCFKIANAPKRIAKLNLKHSLVDKDDDVAIIVSDLQRGAKADYEPTIQHYEDIFREAGIEGLTIIPFNKLRNECNTFETVRKFGNTYDYFLCDGRLVGHASGFCGKVFQKPRTTFHSVRMDNQKNIKREIEKSLRRTAYKQLQKGDLISIPVGNHKFTEDQLAENIMNVLEQLKSTYPGGFPNIRGLYLKINIAGTSTLPIYLSFAEPPTDTPYVVGPREQRLLKMKHEANEVLSHFNMTKEGELLKLSKSDVKRKQKLKDMRAAMELNDLPQPNSGDKTSGKQSVVPAKKARTEKTVDTANKADNEKAKDEKPTVEDHDDEESSEAENQDEDEQDSGEDEDAEKDNDGEDDDEEGEGDEDEDEEGAADSDSDDDDEDDEDDEENATDNEDESEEDDDE